MHEDDSDIQPDPDGDDLPEEFRADPNEHWPILIICAVLAVLSVVGVGWLIVKPDGGVFSILGRRTFVGEDPPELAFGTSSANWIAMK